VTELQKFTKFEEHATDKILFQEIPSRIETVKE
jgi:hypothetical protein